LQVRYVVIGAIVHADISYYVCFSAGKRFFLILGLALLVASVSMIIVCLFVIKPDIVFADSVQMTTTGDYGSPIFYAEKGDWLEFALTTSNCSVSRLSRNDGALVWLVSNHNQQAYLNGAIYNQSLQINLTTDYHVKLENWAQHALDYYARTPTIIRDNNTFSGSFYLLRTPTYCPYLLLSGEALLAASCGILVLPAR